MDGESSYESDISESWSLIDINLNEKSLPSTEASTLLSKSPSSELKNSINFEKSDDIKLEDFVKKCKKSNEIDFREGSDSDSDSSFKIHEVATCCKNEMIASDSSDAGKNDSGDTESIEILDLDGHQESDKLDISLMDQVDFATYPSDDEDLMEDRVNRACSSTVIKRKRQRLNRSSENSVYSINSQTKSGKSNLKTCSSNQKEENHKINESHSPVYKHYRNNVANTFLSLSVGVIFAGVACIAIGHFLGVQNAAETTVELAETLKKLQMENAALQSRLLHLNRALLIQETNSKELPVNQPQPKKLTCEQLPQDPSKTTETDLNKAALSEIRSSLKSIEWLSKMKNILQTSHNGEVDAEKGLNLSEFGKYIHDQLHFLKKRQEEGAKLFEDTDKKISKTLKKIINRLLSSHDNIEILYQRLIKLKNKLNHKPNEIFSDPKEKIQSEHQNRFPVTERDLQTIQWNSGNKIREIGEWFKFPQHEKYYELKSNRTFKTEKSEKKKTKKYKQKKDKKYEKKDKRKRIVKKEEFFKKYNETNIQKRKYQKLENKNARPNRKYKKYKKPKRILISKLQKDFNKKSNQSYSEPQRFNLTGYWVFKWADGRKEFRRGHSLSDWQFERAKIRKEFRVLDQENWQFERAKARKELRDEDFKENWQFKRAFARESNRNNVRWHPEKQTKHNGKEFFHERFPWF